MKLDKLQTYYIIAISVIVLDQLVKYLVHQYMVPGEIGEIHLLGEYFKLHYTTNPGMAFGIELGGDYGKVLLSSFRLIAICGIGWFITKLFKEGAHKGFLLCISFIFAGAVGNLVDSMFYAFLDPINLQVDGAPFAFLHGKVIDMFYIDIAQGYFPDWVPIWGGDYYAFWPIFNVADASIFVSVIVILFRQKKFFDKKPSEEKGVL